MRDTQRGTVKQDGWDVLIMTYNLAQHQESCAPLNDLKCT